MRVSCSLRLLPCLAALVLALPQIDYGPCDYNGNENCADIMDNTACFLNPKDANSLFKCIPGGKEGVCACYGCLGYIPVGEILAKSSACVGVNTAAPTKTAAPEIVTPAPAPPGHEHGRRR
ncbi:hypothetical protein B0T25DRAFT_571002 [Lasiosphaeria hispida]|uniref:Extracellular membrane protein CFEM domain-containing protein n=1 Tax=Lasiosphaeria hispida TaxID=260671 RepID=A0AAJ0HA47_9PEZI|nr:hypothetical protein B0T25DRAFT_571002 [Lasiosphaeria hispida]